MASSPVAMAGRMLRLANDPALREQMGRRAQQHIRSLADPETSIARVEAFLRAALEGRENPFATADLNRAKETAAYLDAHQYGHSLRERLALKILGYRLRYDYVRRKRRSRSSAIEKQPA